MEYEKGKACALLHESEKDCGITCTVGGSRLSRNASCQSIRHEATRCHAARERSLTRRSQFHHDALTLLPSASDLSIIVPSSKRTSHCAIGIRAQSEDFLFTQPLLTIENRRQMVTFQHERAKRESGRRIILAIAFRSICCRPGRRLPASSSG